MTLPITKKKHKFRPMTVKEEKILLLAQRSESLREMASAMVQIIKNCYEDLKTPEKLSIADAEKAFLALRGKSMGEESTFTIRCPETGEVINIKVNLETFDIEKKNIKDGKIKLTDEMLVVVTEPTMEYLLQNEKSESDEMRNLFKNCFVELQTADNVYVKDQLTEKDLDEFYDYMTPLQLKMFSDYIESIPRVKKTIKYHTKDGIDRQFSLFGIDSFFGYASAT